MSRIPNRLYLDVTNRCNQHCLHCSIDAGPEEHNLLSLTELESLIIQAHDMGIGKVVFSGGEPLSRKGVFEVFKKASSMGLKVTILTNGTLIDKQSAEFFRDNDISIKISIDGSTASTHDYLRGKGAFNNILKVFEIIQIIPEKNRAVHFTIHRKNIGELCELPELLEKVKMKNLVIGTIKPSGRASLNHELLIPPGMYPYVQQKIKLLKKDRRISISSFDSKGWEGFGCPAVCDKFGISANGNATTCVFLGDDYLGSNTRENGLHGLWSDYLDQGNIFSANDKCARCDWLEYTGGGCRSRALHFYGDINAPDPYCCSIREQHAMFALLTESR